MRETTTNDIERINVAFLVLGSIAAALITRNVISFFSFAVASAIMTLNFRFLRRIMEAFFARPTIDKKEILIKLPIKFFGLTTLVVIIVVWGNINILFFFLGLSTIFVSVVASQVMAVFGEAPSADTQGSRSGPSRKPAERGWLRSLAPVFRGSRGPAPEVRRKHDGA